MALWCLRLFFFLIHLCNVAVSWTIWKIPYAFKSKCDGICWELVSVHKVLILVNHHCWQHGPLLTQVHAAWDTLLDCGVCVQTRNYSCLWFWHTELWTTRRLCSTFASSSPATAHYLAFFSLPPPPFPFPTIHSVMTKVSTVDLYLACAQRLLHLTPITSLNSECEGLGLDVFVRCVPWARCDVWHLGLTFTDCLDAQT